MQTCEVVKLYLFCLLFFAPTCFGHSCDYLQDVILGILGLQHKLHKMHDKYLQDFIILL
jgi:hypothetical protein